VLSLEISAENDRRSVRAGTKRPCEQRVGRRSQSSISIREIRVYSWLWFVQGDGVGDRRRPLKATGHRLAWLVNFGAHRELEYERIGR
jgi:hypothetical protein